jgi:acetyl-CoA C-acetyltransferase
MREVAILGIGQTPVGEHWNKSLREIAGEAVIAAMADAALDQAEGLFVGNMLSGSTGKQENLGALIADWVGLLNIEVAKMEAACSSGAAAVRAAILAVASGELNCAIAVGVEKMTEGLPVETTSALAAASDADYEADQGLSFVAINALIMRRYIHFYNWKHSDFANFSINAHTNALNNPNARLHERITLDMYNKSRMIAAPINLLDASPIGDGAAAIVIVPKEQVGFHNRAVLVAGSASATDSIAVHSREDPLWLSAAEISAKKAYSQAGVSPSEIDVFELHDAFSIMSALSLEACGFAERGQGPRLALDGDIALTGKIPITTLGGLKGRGHPVGATGVYQIVEVVQQLRGEADKAQIPDAKVGMAQNIGGSGATIITHILRSRN